MRYKLLSILISVFILGWGMQADAKTFAYIDAEIPKAQMVGSGEVTMFMIRVYKATLLAPSGQWAQKKPYALKLDYDVDVPNTAIIDEAIGAIRLQNVYTDAELEKWKERLALLIPNISKGDSMTGIRDKNAHLKFYKNGTYIASIKDKKFANAFFGIWLSNDAENKKLRNKLFGK